MFSLASKGRLPRNLRRTQVGLTFAGRLLRTEQAKFALLAGYMSNAIAYFGVPALSMLLDGGGRAVVVSLPSLNMVRPIFCAFNSLRGNWQSG